MSNTIKRFPPVLVAITLLLITLAVNVSMPLFRIYAMAAHFNNAETSLVFACYILGMLPCYIFLGGISDQIGRRPILICGLYLAFIATGIIYLWPNVYALFFARFFQGIAVGLSMSAGTAYISELLATESNAVRKASLYASLFTAFGFGGGALSTGLILLNKFTIKPVSYPVLLVITFVGILSLFTLPNLKPIGGNLIRLPLFPPGSSPANGAIFMCWAATGVVIAIVPTQMFKFGLAPYTGICLVLINWTGAIVQITVRKIPSVRLLKTGLYLAPLGFAILTVGCTLSWLFVIFLGTAILGSSAYGFCYAGGLSLVTGLDLNQKARSVAGFMFFGYIGFGIPATLLGYIADEVGIINSLWLFEALISIGCFWLLKSILKKNAQQIKVVIHQGT
ncbi:MAG: MFS transporter [Ferruginibacter sp.]